MSSTDVSKSAEEQPDSVNDVAVADVLIVTGGSCRAQWVVGVMMFLTALMFFVSSLSIEEHNRPPHVAGDAWNYESTGFWLSKGYGFAAGGYGDSEWRKPYVENNRYGEFDGILLRDDPKSPNVYRQPAVPVQVAITYTLVGRRFFALYVGNAIVCSIAIGVMSALAVRVAGVVAGIVAGSYCLWSGLLSPYIFDIMTEPLAFLAVTLTFFTFVLMCERQNARRVVMCGVATAAMVYTRNFFAPWLPLLAGFVFWRFRQPVIGAGPGNRRPWLNTLLFLGVTIALLAPWWIRNCYHLNAFMPLGTQGYINFSASYSDDACANRGVWRPTPTLAVRRELEQQEWYQAIGDPLEKHKAVAIACRDRAREWAMANSGKILQLAWMKLRSHLKPLYRPTWGRVLVILSLVGLAVVSKTAVPAIALTLLAADFFTIMLTHSVGGRFLVVVYPVLFTASGIGLAGIVVIVSRWLRHQLRTRST